METNPIITIKSSTADWSNLGYTVCPSEDKGTIEVPIHLGMNRIDVLRLRTISTNCTKAVRTKSVSPIRLAAIPTTMAVIGTAPTTIII